jgi:hypothetical protein
MMSYLQDPAVPVFGMVFGIALAIRIMYNLACFGTLLCPAIYQDVDSKHKYKVTGPGSWTTNFVRPGRNFRGYDVLIPGVLSFYWWFFSSGRSSFKISNFSKEILEIGWGPAGGGDPTTQYWGKVTLAPGCSATVQVATWQSGVGFNAQVAPNQKAW